MFYTQLTQKLYKPALNNLFGFLNQDLKQLHANIETFVKLNFRINEKVLPELPFQVATKFSTKDEEEILSKENHCVSISGCLNFFKPESHELYEIKASILSSWSQEWLVQTLCYALFLDMDKFKVEKISIVNVLKGCIWEWDIIELPKLEEVVREKISTRYERHKLETDGLKRKFESQRKSKEASQLKVAGQSFFAFLNLISFQFRSSFVIRYS